jgi:hypothetical protein
MQTNHAPNTDPIAAETYTSAIALLLGAIKIAGLDPATVLMDGWRRYCDLLGNAEEQRKADLIDRSIFGQPEEAK